MNETPETSKQKKQYYTVKDILLVLRQEYLRIEKEFQALKECCYCEDNQINDYFYFRFGINHLGETDLIVCYLDKEHTIFNNNNPQLRLLTRWNRYVWNFVKSNIVNDNGNYKFEDINCPIKISEDKRKVFNTLIEKILNTPLCGLVTQFIYYDDIYCGLSIEFDRFWTIVRGCFGEIGDTKLTYISHDGAMKEQFLIWRGYSNITLKCLEGIFKVKFDKEDLSEYLQALIEQAEPFDKQIVFVDNVAKKTGQYEIQEDGKKLVLTRWQPDNKYLVKYKNL